MHNWDTSICGISVTYTDKIVRVKIDDILLRYLSKGRGQSFKLAVAIKENYRHLYRKELKISDESLAVEIWGHVYCDKVCALIQKHIKICPLPLRGPLMKLTDYLRFHLVASEVRTATVSYGTTLRH